MLFSEEAWERTLGLREAIHRLPFNTELAAGSLRPERFRFYIMQDALYLAQYSRVLSLAAAKAPDTTSSQIFGHSALGAIAVEQRLHEHYLREFGVEPAAVAAAEPAPDCLAYTSFLLAMAHQQPWEVLVAADFFTIEVWTRRGLTRYVVLFLIDLTTRRVEIAGIATQANGDIWEPTYLSTTKLCLITGPAKFFLRRFPLPLIALFNWQRLLLFGLEVV